MNKSFNKGDIVFFRDPQYNKWIDIEYQCVNKDGMCVGVYYDGSLIEVEPRIVVSVREYMSTLSNDEIEGKIDDLARLLDEANLNGTFNSVISKRVLVLRAAIMDEVDRRFPNPRKGGVKNEDIFASLYNTKYDYFVRHIVKRKDNELILRESNQKISGFIVEMGFDMDDLMGIQRWLDGFSGDPNVYNLNNKTIEVRKATERIFRKQINRIYKLRYKTKDKTTIPDEIFEAVFLRNSIEVGLRVLFPGVLENNSVCVSKKRKSFNPWWLVLFAFLLQMVYQNGKEQPSTFEGYGHAFGYAFGIMAVCFIVPSLISVVVRLITGKWLSSKKFAYGVMGAFIYFSIMNP